MIAIPDHLDVVRDRVVELRRAILHRLLGVGDGWEDLVVDLDGLGGILGLIA